MTFKRPCRAKEQGFGGEVRPVYSSTSARSLLGAAVQRVLSLRGVDF